MFLKNISQNWYSIIIFLIFCHITDSLAHLNASLQDLVDNLKSDDAAMKPIRNFIDSEHGGDQEKYNLLMRKGVREI